MPVANFALHDLGWQAFQQFCHTVLREILGQEVVSFLETDDAGRDGAFVGRWSSKPGSNFEGSFVVQCKHTGRAGKNFLPSDIAAELGKVKQLVNDEQCDVYVLMTNAGMSARSESIIKRNLFDAGVKHVLLLSYTWLNQTVYESSRLRRLVPRLYGLGDLTQILDERAYQQARAVLDAMRSDLDKLVLTSTYQSAARALDDHGFVLLVGAAATGKTTIAAQLALGCADDSDTRVIKIDSISSLESQWNPNEAQLFWLDDAFGATQFDRDSAWSWTNASPRVISAIKTGSMFVMTSRDYIYKVAHPFLKPGSFPLLEESQVVVDVANLNSNEREQILYNHLRHGRQPNSFLRLIQPHLEEAARHPGFTPELARRLADPTFTKVINPVDGQALNKFLSFPKRFLVDVMKGLDADGRAALGLIFVNRDWLPSPVNFNQNEEDLVARLGSSLGGISSSLEAMKEGLVRYLVRDGEGGWVFSHPTMIDAYAELLKSPELLRHLLSGVSIDTFLSQITCGDVGVQGAIIVSKSNYDLVLDRLDEPIKPNIEDGYRRSEARTVFLTTRCDKWFLEEWIKRHPKRMEQWDAGLMLEASVNNEFAVRLNELDLFPEFLRLNFAEEISEFCLTGLDPAVLSSERLRSMLTEPEWYQLLQQVRDEMLTDPYAVLDGCVGGYSSIENPDSAIDPLVQLLYNLPNLFPGDAVVEERVRELERVVNDWRSENSGDIDEQRDGMMRDTSPSPSLTVDRGWRRSVFDDLVDGRDTF